MAGEIPPFESLLYALDGHVCTLTLNRPEKRNALSGQLVNELIVALETARDDPEVRVVVLTGAGNSFCAGADLSQMSGADAGKDSPIAWRGGFQEMNLAFVEIGKPVICKVRRYALAGALALVCNSTFVLAEDNATFGAPEIDRGIFPMMVMASLFRTVSKRRGLELILSGDRISAADAAGMGLITRAVPSEDLEGAVAELAEKLANKPPAAVRLGLEAYHAQSEKDFAEALPYLQEMLMKCLGTEDAQEGVMAFLQKREPVWTGR